MVLKRLKRYGRVCFFTRLSRSKASLCLWLLVMVAIFWYGVSLNNETVGCVKPDCGKSKVEKSHFPVYEHGLTQDSSFDREDHFPLSNGLTKPRPALRVGNTRENATVAIGISSIKRSGRDYLVETVKSLLNHLTPVQKQQTIFVLFIGETDAIYVDKRVKELSAIFQKEIADGTLEVILPPKSFYPQDWTRTISPNFGDTILRTIWRSKQNLDQIFLMMYTYHLKPQYYLMMEDDVIAAQEYMTRLLKATKTLFRRPWIYLSFCKLGAIGKLFRRETLPSYASFLHTFWNAKPLDWLQIDFARSKVCSYDESEQICFRRLQAATPGIEPALFRHVGRISSLPGKRYGQFQNSREYGKVQNI